MRIYFTWYLIPIVAVIVPVYWLALKRDAQRLALAVIVSLGVLALLHPVFAVVVVLLTVVTHQIVAATKDGKLTVRRALLLSILIAVVTLAIGKYGQRAAGNIWNDDDWIVTRLIMPLGISYFVFRMLQYVFDHLRGVLADNSFFRLLAFLTFMPTFPAGPLETYQGFFGKRSTAFDRDLFYRSIRRIVLGYFKKVFVVDFFIAVFLGSRITEVAGPQFHGSANRPLQAIVFVVLVFIRAYIDLSAYTDLAIGFSGLLGFRIMENFDNPLFKKNLGEFWRSWHISLSSWCRNNVYFPVFGATRKVWVGLYSSMLVMGLWHYVDLNWTFWALWHGSGLIALNWWMKRKKKWHKGRRKAGKRRNLLPEWVSTALGYLATFLFVAIGFSFVGTRSITQALIVFEWCFRGPAIFLKHLVM